MNLNHISKLENESTGERALCFVYAEYNDTEVYLLVFDKDGKKSARWHESLEKANIWLGGKGFKHVVTQVPVDQEGMQKLMTDLQDAEAKLSGYITSDAQQQSDLEQMHKNFQELQANYRTLEANHAALQKNYNAVVDQRNLYTDEFDKMNTRIAELLQENQTIRDAADSAHLMHMRDVQAMQGGGAFVLPSDPREQEIQRLRAENKHLEKQAGDYRLTIALLRGTARSIRKMLKGI